MEYTLSIIIPTLNEEKNIGALLTHIEEHASAGLIHEIIVVDGGSTDQTPAIVSPYKRVTLISTEKGRAKQMNTGAQHASGSILYFLHADTYPPEGFEQHILEAAKQGYTGCFRLKFDYPGHFLLKIAPWFTQFNHFLFRGGDQSLFISKEQFDSLLGFDERYVIYEDVDLINRIQVHFPFIILPGYVTTSARKFQQLGTWILYYHFLQIHVRYWLGATPEALYRYYARHIGKHT